jgi:hypothetical protein
MPYVDALRHHACHVIIVRHLQQVSLGRTSFVTASCSIHSVAHCRVFFVVRELLAYQPLNLDLASNPIQVSSIQRNAQFSLQKGMLQIHWLLHAS